MWAIAARNDIEQIRDLKTLLFAKNDEIHRNRYNANTLQHFINMRITQALAFLFPLDSNWDNRMLKIVLNEISRNNIVYINEFIVAETIDSSIVLDIFKNVNTKMIA